MKVVPLSQVKARLSEYAKICRKEPVVVTVNGAPSFQLVPLDATDDLVNQLLEHNPKFRRMLRERLREKSISAKALERRL